MLKLLSWVLTVKMENFPRLQSLCGGESQKISDEISMKSCRWSDTIFCNFKYLKIDVWAENMGGKFGYNTILLRSPLFKRKCVSKASENLFLDFKLFASLFGGANIFSTDSSFDIALFSCETLCDLKLIVIYHLFVILRRFLVENILMFNVNFVNHLLLSKIFQIRKTDSCQSRQYKDLFL